MESTGSRFVQTLVGGSVAGAWARLLGFITVTVAFNHFLEIFELHLMDFVSDERVVQVLTLVSAALLLELAYTRLLLRRTKLRAVASLDPTIQFADAALDFARDLQNRGKSSTVLSLRSNLSRLFHLMGLHKHRVQLGEIALNAANAHAAVDEALIKAEVFLDDLGWATYQAGDKAKAMRNIQHALKLADNFTPTSPQQRVSRGLLMAKANRHLAMLTDSEAEALSYLETARCQLDELSENAETKEIQRDDVARDQAQLLHAKASIIARGLEQTVGARVPASDLVAVEKLGLAIQAAECSERSFRTIGDIERQAKALELLERLYASSGDNAMLLETSSKRQHILQISSIDRRAK